MTILLPVLAIAFAAVCVWLTVRVVNRRERWAKWMLAAGISTAMYGGAYPALLDPNPQWDKTETVYLSGPHGEGRYIIVPAEGARPVPNYRFGGVVVKVVFTPAHWLDRFARRMKWAARPTDHSPAHAAFECWKFAHSLALVCTRQSKRFIGFIDTLAVKL